MHDDLGTFDGAAIVQAQSPPSRFSATLTFDWARPPLTANQRMHWRKKAAITKDVRTAARLAAHRIPDLGRCEVTLTWFVKDRRRRDADNLISTLKPLCDGLVDAGVVQDDTPLLMVKHMPIIMWAPDQVPHFELRVETLPVVLDGRLP